MPDLPAVETRTLRQPRRRSRRSRRLNLAIAGITWTLGAAALIFEIWVAAQGKLTPYNLLNTLFVALGCALGGALALSGDGDVILFTGADEGQRAAFTKAAACAFGLAFSGLFVLWMAWQFQPAWRGGADLQAGVLLLVTTIVYLLAYLWQRRRG
jgi:hypothetical protein